MAKQLLAYIKGFVTNPFNEVIKMGNLLLMWVLIALLTYVVCNIQDDVE